MQQRRGLRGQFLYSYVFNSRMAQRFSRQLTGMHADMM